MHNKPLIYNGLLIKMCFTFPFDISLVLRRRSGMGKTIIFPLQLKPFWSIGSCSAIKTNQWPGGGVERAYGYAARQNGRGLWLYKWLLCRRISDFFSSAMKTFPHWLFAEAEICHWNASAAGLDLLQRSACRFPVFPLPPSGDYLKEPHKKSKF